MEQDGIGGMGWDGMDTSYIYINQIDDMNAERCS